MAYVLRFINNCRNKNNRLNNSLSVQELDNALFYLLRISQRTSYPKEVKVLSNGHLAVSSKSKILNLDPFYKDGLLRVGGRLANSEFPYNKRHPIIISSKHRLCKLIFRHEHIQMLHAGPQALLYNIREFLWPVSGRSLAKAIVHECVTCFRFKSNTLTPIMGNLPQTRLQPGYPFQACGVDYAGPFFVRDRSGRGFETSKCYMALFVCFAVKAYTLN